MPNFPSARIGVIGGSGMYEIEGFGEIEEVYVSTPFGDPSDRLIVGNLEGVTVAFLPRHGRGHRISPSEINYRANVYALKALGVERLISISAVGSMREDVHPCDILVPDQLFDRTVRRARTFFSDGVVAHVALAEPYCPDLIDVVVRAADGIAPRVHRGGTYICIEGPQFSTKAESRIYRQWGVDIIGMTAMPEARLAREAELCYVTMAMVTDYDVWHETHEGVTVEQVNANLTQNTANAKQILRRLIKSLPPQRPCPCGTALANSIVTKPADVPPVVRQRLEVIAGKYL
ncbi:MAG TPA: S-methyl-5'-thioadenosine phosphorylase [Chloroflexota bacterium]|nr:S-methyl-5'-thioadenosine phosphorylase [Chloroflexota bacterium]